MPEKVLVINTGGTISMVHSEAGNHKSPLRPSKSWDEVIQDYQFLKKMNVEYVQTEEIIDSSDMNVQTWREIASIIGRNYEKYKGFVVLHGTDTMSYTASMLSFMLKNLGKTVILTGAQRPIRETRSDGLQNLLTSIEIIERQEENGLEGSKEKDGKDNRGYEEGRFGKGQREELPIIPEVCVFFRDYLLRGNRSRKLDASNYFGFSSPNYPYLGEAGSQIRVYSERLLKMPREKFYVDYGISTDVVTVDIFPGFNPEILKRMFSGNPKIKGLILKTYGNGNAPQDKKFLEAIRYIVDSGAVILNVTQCNIGKVEMGFYEVSSGLLDLGVVGGNDMTPEAAVTKLMYLLGKYSDAEKVKEKLQENMAGEITS